MTRRRQRRALAAWESRTRAISGQAARTLALTIVEGRAHGMQAYDLGIVLGDDETAWQRAPAYYSWRGERSWLAQHNSRFGHHSTINEVHQPCMYTAGMLDWLTTNQRLAARRSDGHVISIWWSAVEGISADLTTEIVVLDGIDGYHGELRGPAVAPIAVAAIATCYGPRALLDHPALEPLRRRRENHGNVTEHPAIDSIQDQTHRVMWAR
jgi:hypothetical protein